MREALLAWQYAGRDCGARWLAFATPNPAALATLARAAQASEDAGEGGGGGGGGGGLVELGPAQTEQEIFAALGLDWREPIDRNCEVKPVAKAGGEGTLRVS